jgi:hypothetical protein
MHDKIEAVSKARYWVVLPFFTGHSSFALLSNSKKFQRTGREKISVVGKGSERG